MGSLVNVVSRIIKEEHDKIYKLGKTVSLILCGLFFGIIAFSGTIILKANMLSILLSFFLILVSVLALFKYKDKNPYIVEEKIFVITSIHKELVELGIESSETIDLFINEVDLEIERLKDKEKENFKRISKIFFWVFWAPLAFLTKFVIENKILEIKEINDYFILVTVIGVGSFLCIVYSLAAGNIMEIPYYFTKTSVNLTKRYLIDLKYFYLESQLMNKSIQRVKEWENTNSNLVKPDEVQSND